MLVQLKEHRPSEYLLPFVDVFWEGSINKSSPDLLSQKVIPNGYVELIIHLSDLHCDLLKENEWSQSPIFTLIGVYTQPYQVIFRGEVNVFAIRFKPEGFYSIFGLPAALFHSKFEDLKNVLDSKFHDFCFRIKEAKSLKNQIEVAECFLFKRLESIQSPISYLNRAAELIRKTHGTIHVDELAKHSFISVRQLEREFTSKIGVTPKQYIRLSRFNEVQRQLSFNQEMSFTRLAYHCGYSDQAHFIRDFRSFTGDKPKFFQNEKHLYISYM